MNDIATDDLPLELTERGALVWSAPRLERLGSMRDARSNGVQPPNDGSGSPTMAAS